MTLFFAQGPTSGTVVSCQIIIDPPFQLDRAEHVDHVDPKRNDTLPPLCRLLHHAVIVVTSGESHRMKQARTRGGHPKPTND